MLPEYVCYLPPFLKERQTIKPADPKMMQEVTGTIVLLPIKIRLSSKAIAQEA